MHPTGLLTLLNMFLLVFCIKTIAIKWLATQGKAYAS